MNINDALEMAFEQTMELNNKYGQSVDARDVQKVINKVWNFISTWPEDLQREAVGAYISGAYCKLSPQPIEGCEEPMDEEEAEQAFEESLEARGVDPNKYRSFEAVWSRVWNYTKDYGANVQKEIYWLFAQYQYRMNPSVRSSGPLFSQPQPQPQAQPQQPTLSEEEKKTIALAMILSATKNVVPEEEAVNEFNQEWEAMKNLPLDKIATVVGGLVNDLIRKKQAPPENAKVVVQPLPKPSAAPASSSSSSSVSAPPPDVEAAELLTLEYGMHQANPPPDVVVDLKRKLAVMQTELEKEKQDVIQGRSQYMKVEDLLLLTLLENYGDNLIAYGWRPVLSGEDMGVITYMWYQLRGFMNFYNKYDEKMETPVKVQVAGREEEMPAWQVMVYATLGELLKKLNIPDKYGLEYYSDLLRQMAA